MVYLEGVFCLEICLVLADALAANVVILDFSFVVRLLNLDCAIADNQLAAGSDALLEILLGLDAFDFHEVGRCGRDIVGLAGRSDCL